MSFLKSLFGVGQDKAPSPPSVAASEDYEGFVIKAVTMKSGSEYQLAGSIEKEVAGELKIAQFIRADKFASAEDASAATMRKGRQIIDEQGEGVFR